MDATFSTFDHQESAARVREILAIPDSAYAEKDSIPTRDQLTFENGYYVKCTALFVDMRGSKELSDKYNLAQLAKIYRVYASEMVSILRSHPNVCEISIEGDCVWGVYDTPFKEHVDLGFNVAATAASFINIVNAYLRKISLGPLKVGIGMAYGSALMVKAGAKGSAVNDIVWAGKVVGEAAKLCSYGNRTWSDNTLMVSRVVRDNLNAHNASLLTWNGERNCYHGDVVMTDMQRFATAIQ